MSESKDLYALLGLLPDAEAAVVSAAYRALASRYHPDRWTGPPEVAHNRMVEINAAYEVLGNAQRRAEYDKQRKSDHGRFSSQTDEADQAFTDALQELEDRWEVAVSVFPEIDRIRSRLSKTSHQLAFAFVTQLLASKKFSSAGEIANHLEQSFLERYFGEDQQIVSFARELIGLGKRDAVKALNRLVEVLGSDVDPDRIISKVVRDYELDKARAEFAAAAEEEAKQRAIRDRIYVLKQRLQSQPYVDLAKELASPLGYHVDEVGGSLFKNAEYVVRRDYAEVGRFPSGPDFVMWVKGALLT